MSLSLVLLIVVALITCNDCQADEADAKSMNQDFAAPKSMLQSQPLETTPIDMAGVF